MILIYEYIQGHFVYSELMDYLDLSGRYFPKVALILMVKDSVIFKSFKLGQTLDQF